MLQNTPEKSVNVFPDWRWKQSLSVSLVRNRTAPRNENVTAYEILPMKSDEKEKAPLLKTTH